MATPQIVLADLKVGTTSGLAHSVTVITAEREVGAIVLVWLGEVVGRAMKQPGHTGHDDFTHVGRFVLLVRVGAVSVNRVPHLGVHSGAVSFPSSRGDRRL